MEVNTAQVARETAKYAGAMRLARKHAQFREEAERGELFAYRLPADGNLTKDQIDRIFDHASSGAFEDFGLNDNIPPDPDQASTFIILTGDEFDSFRRNANRFQDARETEAAASQLTGNDEPRKAMLARQDQLEALLKRQGEAIMRNEQLSEKRNQPKLHKAIYFGAFLAGGFAGVLLLWAGKNVYDYIQARNARYNVKLQKLDNDMTLAEAKGQTNRIKEFDALAKRERAKAVKATNEFTSYLLDVDRRVTVEAGQSPQDAIDQHLSVLDLEIKSGLRQPAEQMFNDLQGRGKIDVDELRVVGRDAMVDDIAIGLATDPDTIADARAQGLSSGLAQRLQAVLQPAYEAVGLQGDYSLAR